MAVDHLTKRFDAVTALNDLTVEVHAGITGLVGANGAGKTTLMSLMLGVSTPSAGAVRTFGSDPVTNRVAISQRVAFVPERNVLPDEMRAIDYTYHLARINGLPAKAAKTQASDALFLVGLGEERVRPLGTMSTGQRQRAKMAQALASSPDLIMLDEPTSGLDPAQRRGALDLLRHVNERAGVSILVSSHLLDEIEQVCDHVIVLDAGKLVASGPTASIFGRHDLGYRIEFGEPLSAEQMHGFQATLSGLLPGAAVAVPAGSVDPTVLVDIPPGMDIVTFTNGCRDAIANTGLRLRFFGPRRADAVELFDTARSPHGSTP